MKTMLSDVELSDAEVADMAEAALAFHRGRARYDEEQIREEVMGLEAWRKWNEDHPRTGSVCDIGEWKLDDVTDADIEAAAASLSPKRRPDLTFMLAFVFGLVIATAVWVSVIIDFYRVRH